MANEYVYTIQNQGFIKGAVNVQIPNRVQQVTVAGSNYVRYTYTATTADTSLPLGSIGTIGYVHIKNTDATNYVQVGDGTSYNIQLWAGATMGPDPWGGAAVHVKAHTASCVLEVFIVEA